LKPEAAFRGKCVTAKVTDAIISPIALSDVSELVGNQARESGSHQSVANWLLQKPPNVKINIVCKVMLAYTNTGISKNYFAK